MIWIILELAKNYLKLANRRLQHRLTNLIRMSRFHETRGLLFESCSSNYFMGFHVFLSVAISWKLKARRAAKGVQYRPRIFSFHVITRVGLRRALPSFRIPALRKHCGPCEAHYVPEGSAVFRHPHLLSIFRFTLHTSRRKWASCTGHQLREDLTKAMMTCYDQIDEWLSSKSSSNLKLS